MGKECHEALLRAFFMHLLVNINAAVILSIFPKNWKNYFTKNWTFEYGY